VIENRTKDPGRSSLVLWTASVGPNGKPIYEQKDEFYFTDILDCDYLVVSPSADGDTSDPANMVSVPNVRLTLAEYRSSPFRLSFKSINSRCFCYSDVCLLFSRYCLKRTAFSCFPKLSSLLILATTIAMYTQTTYTTPVATNVVMGAPTVTYAPTATLYTQPAPTTTVYTQPAPTVVYQQPAPITQTVYAQPAPMTQTTTYHPGGIALLVAFSCSCSCLVPSSTNFPVWHCFFFLFTLISNLPTLQV
jgi:hypothetical protein